MKAIIIDEPWIGKILDGRKTWEMRSKPTKERGLVGLIKKRMKQVHGVARLVGSLQRLEPYKLAGTEKFHGIPPNMFRMVEERNWLNPWVLDGVRRLTRPVPYVHTSQVGWVILDPAAEQAILEQINS